MESVIAFAHAGGPVLGICNGFQILCEAGLLPGALLPNKDLRFVCRQVDLEVQTTATPFTSTCAVGQRLSIPAKHTTGCFFGECRDEQVVLRYAEGHNFNGSQDDIAGVVNAQGNVMGLMPHPEHAVDVADRRLGRRPEAVRGDGPCRRRLRPLLDVPGIEQAVALGLTRDEYAMVIEELGGREPNEVELAMFSLLWSEHCAYKHSKKLLRTLPTEGPAVVMGPGENAGAVDVGDGWAVAFKVESHNHPSRGRAVPGRGDRRRRHPARHLRARRAADRDPRLAALRRAGLRALALPARPRRGRHRPLRQLDRRADRRRRGRLRGARTRPTAWSTRWPSAWRGPRTWSAAPRRASATSWCCSARPRAATASAARRCWPRPSWTSRTTTKRPSVQVGDPFEESKLLECSLELLAAGCWWPCRTSAPRA